MVSDEATIFTSKNFKKFCQSAGIFQKFIALGHPATNRLAKRNVQTLQHRLAAMASEPFSMRQKVREILFRYQATPLSIGSYSELFLNRQIRITLDALKPVHHEKSALSNEKPRQFSAGERVQARYYTNNKQLWKTGEVIKRFGLLHYQVKLDDEYSLKRHIDQIRSSNLPKSKSVFFVPEVEVTYEDESKQPIITDLLTIPVQDKQANQPDNIQNEVFEPAQGEVPDDKIPHPPTNITELRRSCRPVELPSCLNDYIVERK
nr:uncharacterized protein K02A2.6-like [Leptinotarsa decemlineata]